MEDMRHVREKGLMMLPRWGDGAVPGGHDGIVFLISADKLAIPHGDLEPIGSLADWRDKRQVTKTVMDQVNMVLREKCVPPRLQAKPDLTALQLTSR
jgi:hypothetical protein